MRGERERMDDTQQINPRAEIRPGSSHYFSGETEHLKQLSAHLQALFEHFLVYSFKPIF